MGPDSSASGGGGGSRKLGVLGTAEIRWQRLTADPSVRRPTCRHTVPSHPALGLGLDMRM